MPDPFDTAEWRAYAKHARDDMLPKVAESAISLSIVPPGEPNMKFLLELGAIIWYGKPLVLLAGPGIEVPPGLRRVATSIVVGDLSTPTGQALMQEAIEGAIRDLPNPDGESWT